MAQDAYPANSSKWDGKRLTLTENTQKNMMKKAYTLDAENMLQSSGYNLEGNEAIKAVEQNGITQEQLIEQEGTYSNLIATAIEMLQRNANKIERNDAVNAIGNIGYTNLFIQSTDSFILPQEVGKDDEEIPIQEVPTPKAKEPESRPTPYNPYYGKSNQIQARANQAAKVARAQAAQYETQPIAEQSSESFIKTLIPNVGRNNLKPEVTNKGVGPKVFINTNRGNAKLAVQPRPLPNVMARAQQSQVPQQTVAQQAPVQVAQRSVAPRSQVPQANRPLLNSNVAVKLGGRMGNPVAPRNTVAAPRQIGNNGGNSLTRLMVKKKKWF